MKEGILVTSNRIRPKIQAGDVVRIVLSGLERIGTASEPEYGKNSCDQCMLQHEQVFCAAFPCIRNRLVLKPLESTPKEKRMSSKIDPNVVALVREDAITVKVKFSNSPDKEFTYVSTKKLDLKPDDMVVVPNINGYSLATVLSVDNEVLIPLDDDKKYVWILAKVDMSYGLQLVEENKLIEETIRDNYKAQAQRSFRNQILSGLSADVLGRLPSAVTAGMSQLPNNTR